MPEWEDRMMPICVKVEALAHKFELSLVHRVGCNRLVINSDNLKVIDTLKSRGYSTGTAVAVFDDYYHFAYDFPMSRFEDCNVEANKVAHELVRLARFSSTLDWLEEPLY